MILSKKCVGCDNLIIKTSTTSLKSWNTTKKYCSISCGAKNRVVSDATKNKIRDTALRLGNRPPRFDELSLEQKRIFLEKRSKQKPTFLGRKHNKETLEKFRLNKIGNKSPTWKGGITYARNYKRMKKMEYLGRKFASEGTHTKQEWEDLKKKFNYMCLCCKKHEPEIKLTEDHIIPLTKGGSDYIDNIQPLCGKCNSSKYTKILSYISISELQP